MEMKLEDRADRLDGSSAKTKGFRSRSRYEDSDELLEVSDAFSRPLKIDNPPARLVVP